MTWSSCMGRGLGFPYPTLMADPSTRACVANQKRSALSCGAASPACTAARSTRSRSSAMFPGNAYLCADRRTVAHGATELAKDLRPHLHDWGLVSLRSPLAGGI